LGEVCEVTAGQSPRGEYYNDDGVGLPFYQGKKEFQYKYIGEPKKWTSVTTKEANKDDILMSVRAPVGPINFATQNICIGRGLASIRAGNLVNKDYLYYFLIDNENKLVSNVGAVFDSINKDQIKAITIPTPSLEKQTQIINFLDSFNNKTQSLESKYQQELNSLEELKKSILEKAFNGEL
jgi:restriction endonuclease S subunit